MTKELESKSGRLYTVPGKEYFTYFAEDLDRAASEALKEAIANESYVMGVVLPTRKVVWSTECQMHANLALSERVDYEKEALARFQVDKTPNNLRVQAHVLEFDMADSLGRFLQPVTPPSATFSIMHIDTFLRGTNERFDWIYNGRASSYQPRK
jgi:hypothetical protein